MILTHVVHLLHDTGAPAPRAPPRCPELRSARPAWAADFCVSLCSHQFRQEPGPRPRHLTGPLMLELPRRRLVAQPASAEGLVGRFPPSDPHSLRRTHVEPSPFTIPSNSLLPTPDECHGACSTSWGGSGGHSDRGCPVSQGGGRKAGHAQGCGWDDRQDRDRLACPATRWVRDRTAGLPQDRTEAVHVAAAGSRDVRRSFFFF